MSEEYLDLSGINSPDGKAEALSDADFPILKGLSPLSMRILNNASRVMQVAKDVEMLHEGDTPHDLYFIKQGTMSIGRKSGSQLKVIARLKAGETYGEFGALRRKSRYASVITAEPSIIIRVELSAIQQVLDADKTFHERLEALLKQRMLESFFTSHPVFSKLTPQLRREFASTLPTHFYDRDVRIFSQGRPPQGIYLILSGEVEIRHTNRHGQERLLEIRRDNDLLGEVANKNGTELAYSAVAASDVDMLVLDVHAMKIIHERHPETYKILENYINKRAERAVVRLRENMK